MPLIITRVNAARTVFRRCHNKIQEIFFIQRPCPLSGYYYLHVPPSRFSLVRVITRFSHRDETPASSRESTCLMLLPTEILIKKLTLITTYTRQARVQRDASRATTAVMRERESRRKTRRMHFNQRFVGFSSLLCCVQGRTKDVWTIRGFPLLSCRKHCGFSLISMFPSHAVL